MVALRQLTLQVLLLTWGRSRRRGGKNYEIQGGAKKKGRKEFIVEGTYIASTLASIKEPDTDSLTCPSRHNQ